jgi:RNA polymerase sigma factor (sigma-70 family)
VVDLKQRSIYRGRFTYNPMSMSVSDHHEDEIVEGCLQGGRKYQRMLYERYYGSMIVVCMRYTNDREEARDVLHEGFLKVFNNLEKFTRGTNLGAWIRRIMVNTAIDHYRKSAKRPNLVEINHAVHEADMHDVVSDLSAEEILEMVQKLSPAYRMVFNLYVIEGYSHKEVAKSLNISEGTSKSNLAKARGKLQQMVMKSRTVRRAEGENYA